MSKFSDFFRNLFSKQQPTQPSAPNVVSAPSAPISAPVVTAPVPTPPVAVPPQPDFGPTVGVVTPPYINPWSWDSSQGIDANYMKWIDAKMPSVDTTGHPCGAPVREPENASIQTVVLFENKTLQQVKDEINAWMNGHVPELGNFGEWRGRKLTTVLTPGGINITPIVQNFNDMIDKGMTTTWYIPYILEAAPTQLAFDVSYGRPLWADLYACFTGTGSAPQRQMLNLKDDEGQPGGVRIEGGKFIITVFGGKEVSYTLPYGGLSVHNGFPEVK